MKLTPRFTFVPFATWDRYGKERWPGAVSYGDYKVIGYDSPTQSEVVKAAADETGLEQINHEVCTAQMIIDGMTANEQKLFNCSLEVAQEVAASFNLDDDNE